MLHVLVQFEFAHEYDASSRLWRAFRHAARRHLQDQATILPSSGFHNGVSLIIYGISRYTDRADLWPASQLANSL